MSEFTRAVLLSWDIRIDVVLSLTALALLYWLGWRRLRQRGSDSFANRWRLASYWSGLILVGISLMSPIDVMASQLFLMHMVQHLVLMMFAAPLMILANPFPVVLWALPRQQRLAVGRLFQRDSRVQRVLTSVLRPGLIWMLFVAIYLGWHDPDLYSLSLRNGFVHDVQHLTFFGAALLFWWYVIGASPQIGKRPSAILRAIFAVSMVPPNMIAGLAITMAEKPVYTYYTQIPRIFPISALADQTWAGLIMWIPGSMMFIVAAVLIFGVQTAGRQDRPMNRADAEGNSQREKWQQLRKLRSSQV